MASPEQKAAKTVARLTEHESVVWNALMLAQSGIYVFPVLLTDPTPKPTGGVKATKRYPVKWGTEASIDAEAVADMFERNPTAAVGIATGPSRLIAIDLDHGTKDGAASLHAAGLELPPPGMEYDTLGGGRHVVYRSPDKRYAKTLADLPYLPEGAAEPIKLEGVDIRATGGMLVYYGPRIEKALDLAAMPEAPAWAIVDAAPQGTKSAPSLTMQTWLGALRPGPIVKRVDEAMRAVKRNGMGHGELLVATNRLAELGAQGATGVPQAIARARERYVGTWGALYEKAWDDAMTDAAQYYGTPPVILMPRPPLMAPAEVEPEPTPDEPKAKPAKSKALVPLKAPKEVVVAKKLPPTTPDDFIEPKTGLNSERLAEYVAADGRVGLGADERFWWYERGAWAPRDGIVRDKVTRLVKERYRREHVGVARDMLAANPDLPRITGVPHEHLINVKNGMLDWRTGELLAHSPAHLSTVQLAVSYLGPGQPTPLFDRWLALVSADDEEMALTLRETIAYAVYNGNPFQKAMMLHGRANGGKSKFIELIERITGAGNVAHLTPEQMEERFSKADLLGKLLNTQGEHEGKRLVSTNAFKSIIGGDEISAERKGRDAFTFRPWAFHIFAGNEFDSTSDTTEGYYRRWAVVEFTRDISTDVDWSTAEFMAEADAIFSNAIELLPAMIEQKSFTPTTHLMRTQAKMRLESDTAAQWLDDDMHVLLHDPSARVSSVRSHLYQQYFDWATRSGSRPMSNQALYRRLERLGHHSYKTNGVYRIRGVQVDTVPIGALNEPEEARDA